MFVKSGNMGALLLLLNGFQFSMPFPPHRSEKIFYSVKREAIGTG
jgi:hypothetical protein